MGGEFYFVVINDHITMSKQFFFPLIVCSFGQDVFV